MKRVQFVFGIHNHQPVGNFDYVFEEAFQKSYLPFIEVLERHPAISMALHFSGCLLEWLEEHHPEYLDRVANLVKRGNIEILAAGFYEPVLAVIPDKDKLGQIKKLRDYVEKRFDYQAKGAWLTERVWEPHLAKPVSEAGIDYITVDDYHFLASGKELDELNGYYNTDEQGHTVGVFPISQRLRYAMPFKDPEATIDILRDYATEEGDNVIVMADDGEKFGLWPGTFESCYGMGQWLDRFFTALEENIDWITTTTFKKYYESHPPRGLAFLPTISYFEMSEWTLPPLQGGKFDGLVDKFSKDGTMDDVRPFLRGGTWRNFQSLYHESNWMQKRTTEFSYRLEAAFSRKQIDETRYTEARDHLWRAQCNCAYWHGVFGGLYLPHLRHAIFTHLNQAEAILDKAAGIDTLAKDIDSDGALEYKLQSEKIKLIAGAAGGALKEFDILPRSFNLLNTMRRYGESYHSKLSQANKGGDATGSIHDLVLAKEDGLEEHLQIDSSQRLMLQDHFFSGETSAAALRKGQSGTGDFQDKTFKAEQNGALIFSGSGSAAGQPLEIVKKLKLDDNRLDVELTITNLSDKTFQADYSSELNFALLGGHTPDRYFEFNGIRPEEAWLDGEHDLDDLSSIAIVNEWDRFRVTVQFPEKTPVWCHPVETVSMSEAGFEKVYQSSAVYPHWPLNLAPGSSITKSFTLLLDLLDG